MENSLWLVWKQPNSRKRYVVGELTYDQKKYTFKYLKEYLEEAKENGFYNFPGFDDLEKEYECEELFQNILSRLPNKTRPDYLEILNFYDLDSTSTKMEILKNTRGRLLTDNYEFVPVFNKQKLEFEVAGTTHCVDFEKYRNMLEINENLILEKEPNNKYDKYAIKIMFRTCKGTYHLGYVPRYYTKQLTELLDKNIKYSARIKYLKLESLLNDENITAEVKLIFE